jgi:hypothetical protein
MINQLAKEAHATQIEKGFAKIGEKRNFAECIALVHSELSEALEGNREGCLEPESTQRLVIEGEISKLENDPSSGKPTYDIFKKSPGFELADAVIRILGMVEEHHIKDFEWYIKTKMKYNSTRPHKHGKSY